MWQKSRLAIGYTGFFDNKSADFVHSSKTFNGLLKDLIIFTDVFKRYSNTFSLFLINLDAKTHYKRLTHVPKKLNFKIKLTVYCIALYCWHQF